MTWWRVILGIGLLVLVLLISGTVSMFFASHGNFRAANALMIAPDWMEKYKPDAKAYLEAGLLYQNGNYEEAVEAFGRIDGYEVAARMKSISAVKLASEKLNGGDREAADAALSEVDPSVLLEESIREYEELCAALRTQTEHPDGQA